ncbi:MAG: tetratricopeptide repeat protein [Bacteroidetes bacterium]|nr:MAG: tetratricopeptide repeat protein [Bacteroidota bacterium]
MKNKFIIVSLFVVAMGKPALHAQQVNDIIKKGNDLYKQQQYEPAKAAYGDALAKDSANTTAKFNLANTSYRLSKPDEAIKSLDELSVKYKTAGEKARTYYNKGVVLSSQKRLEESIEAYKEALRQDPNDKEARENLQKALIELKKRTPPPPKKDNQKKKQEKKQQPKMDKKEAEQKLKLLEQKEKQLQQKMQQQKFKTGGNSQKDW